MKGRIYCKCVFLIGLCSVVLAIQGHSKLGKTYCGTKNAISVILTEVEDIVSQIELLSGCRTGQKHNLSVHEQRRIWRKIETILSEVDDPVVLREVFYFICFRCEQWVRLNDDDGPAFLESKIQFMVEGAVLQRLAGIRSKESMETIMGFFKDPSISCDGMRALNMRQCIEMCAVQILPQLKEYVRHGGKRAYFANELIKEIEK